MSDYQRNPGSKNDTAYWLIAVGLLCTGFGSWIGVLMIVLKLLDGDSKKKKRQQGRHPYYQQAGREPLGARTASAPEESARQTAYQAPPAWEQPKKNAPKAPKLKKKAGRDLVSELDKKGKSWAIAGGATAAGCFIGLIGSIGDALYWLFSGDIAFFMEELSGPLVLLCCVAGGLGCLWAGLRKQKQAKRYRSYLNIIGQRSVVSISYLSSATGRTPAQVRDDLDDMLDDGLFPQGFLDYGGDRLVLSGEDIVQPPRQEERPAPQPSKGDESAVLSEIRAVNDAIDNEKMSAQIDRIGVITAKILDYQKSHPDKAPQLHSFLSYYLPTTLKILRAYAQLEDQEISGQNITAAMQRIEGMMDKVVEGFEKQLDLLFQGDAMDITTDVEVLERMLAKDGLSDQEGLTLGL
ncbi:hypothetical protein D1641_12140 [Colidextribacter sp. OB.20]|uniref:5-bromo-4-chloroindolyl phosphate hydrolysis family protein n=1 Tax=Colidextribacter sp. OB.20 TaxID=2304568 RepID=UPI00137009CD|nr:5-bromo-4-chloroindolyl phosphate hydrolysis family protein [Colidextribacter sp. OB.20]NBI10756.1 hypothetical protein [Colidextribacter sp. OB.20]